MTVGSSHHSPFLGLGVVLAVLAAATILAFRLLNPAWVTYRQAVAALHRGDTAKAAQLFDRIGDADIPPATLAMHIAEVRMAEKDFPAAEGALRKVLELEPDNLEATKMLAGSLQQRHEAGEAIHAYLDAAEAGATLDPHARLHLADLYRQDRSYRDAEKIYHDLIAEDQLAPEATFQLAQVLAWQRKYPDSIKLLQSLLEADPSDRKVRLELARILGWAGRTDDSVAEYQKLLAP